MSCWPAFVIGSMMMTRRAVVGIGMSCNSGRAVGTCYTSCSLGIAVVAGKSPMMGMWIGIGYCRSRSCWWGSENRRGQTLWLGLGKIVGWRRM